MQCIAPATGKAPTTPPRACVLRGRIRAIKQLDTLPSASWLQEGFASPVLNKTVDIEIAPDDNLYGCSTPLETTDTTLRLPEADYPDLVRAGRVRILGAERISSDLQVGKQVCGWTRYVARPGNGYPTGWEGELLGGDVKDASWKLLGAYSLYVGPSTNAHLWRSWSFTREGAARRIPVDGGGAFIVHDGVGIRHEGQTVVSREGDEVILKAPDGTFAVQATSDFTVGAVPANVGRHDGFFFAAVRVTM